MKDFFKLKTWLITFLMFTIAAIASSLIVYFEFGGFKQIKITEASSSDNVSGWAWNSNIGWISFNCTDKTCANDRNRPCAVDADCVAVGGVCNDVCSASNYGVNIDLASGNFSGYAWSNNIGWIYFGPDANLPGYGLTQASDAPEVPKIWAHYDRATGLVTGWAKILTLGDNGWLKMSDDNNSNWSGKGVKINPTINEMSGWAWNNNDNGAGIGWISLNCNDVINSCSGGTNPGTPCPNGIECTGGGSCLNTCAALADYKVIGQVNRPPTATNLSAPNLNFAQAAGPLGALNATLSWTFSDDPGDTESAYQIIVRKTDNSLVFDSGKCLAYGSCVPVGCDPTKCKVDNGASGTTNFPLTAADGLAYNTPYYWWVRVWDNYDVPSVVLTQYNISPDTPPEADDGNPLTFTTYKHEFPSVRFSWVPVEPHKGEKVKFYDASKVYLTGAPTTPVNCNSLICNWFWTIPASATFNDPINDPASSTPAVTFTTSGTVTLRVTDNDGYWSASSTLINIGLRLPTWIEVKPQ